MTQLPLLEIPIALPLLRHRRERRQRPGVASPVLGAEPAAGIAADERAPGEEKAAREPSTKATPVLLHIYDLGAPAVEGVNHLLRAVGTGAFHAGVELYGLEWSFGAIPEEDGSDCDGYPEIVAPDAALASRTAAIAHSDTDAAADDRAAGVGGAAPGLGVDAAGGGLESRQAEDCGSSSDDGSSGGGSRGGGRSRCSCPSLVAAVPLTGVFSCEPRNCPPHIYRESVFMGVTELSQASLEVLLDSFSAQWLSRDYDLLRRNCCHFADALCQAVGVGPVPEWVTNLAAAAATLQGGAMTVACTAQAAAIVAAAKAGEIEEAYRIRQTVGETVAPVGEVLCAAVTRVSELDEEYQVTASTGRAAIIAAESARSSLYAVAAGAEELDNRFLVTESTGQVAAAAVERANCAFGFMSDSMEDLDRRYSVRASTGQVAGIAVERTGCALSAIAEGVEDLDRRYAVTETTGQAALAAVEHTGSALAVIAEGVEDLDRRYAVSETTTQAASIAVQRTSMVVSAAAETAGELDWGSAVEYANNAFVSVASGAESLDRRFSVSASASQAVTMAAQYAGNALLCAVDRKADRRNAADGHSAAAGRQAGRRNSVDSGSSAEGCQEDAAISSPSSIRLTLPLWDPQVARLRRKCLLQRRIIKESQHAPLQ